MSVENVIELLDAHRDVKESYVLVRELRTYLEFEG